MRTPCAARSVRRADFDDEAFIKISLTHPALAGHFPGNPIVPGVVVLDQVTQALALFLNDEHIRVLGFPTIKFIAPLAPESEFEIAFQRKGVGQATFDVLAQGGKIASGTVAYEYIG